MQKCNGSDDISGDLYILGQQHSMSTIGGQRTDRQQDPVFNVCEEHPLTNDEFENFLNRRVRDVPAHVYVIYS